MSKPSSFPPVDDLRKELDAVKKPQYDPDFTDRVIAATGPGANPRLAKIMPSLVRHLHDFAREVDLTVDEWMAGVEMLNQAGRMSDEKRNEMALVCDVLGLESLVDEITWKQQHRLQAAGAKTNTPSAILGPFYRVGMPPLPLGASILQAYDPKRFPDPAAAAKAKALYDSCLPLISRVSGRVRAHGTGRPIPGATLEVWQCAPNGLYEQQDDLQPDMNLRGSFTTTASSSPADHEADESEAGRFSLVCLKPTAYPVPDDGPAGHLLGLLDRHPFRPGHLHFVVSAPGFRSLTTQVFDRDDPYVVKDSVFAVKDDLLVRFLPVEGAARGAEDGPDKAKWHLEFEFSLAEA